MQKIIYPILCFILIILSCTNNKKENETSKQVSSYIKYAKGFKVITKNNHKILRITSAYQNANKNYDYFISKDKKKEDLSKNEIIVPVKKMIVTSTTHIPMIELLEEENSIIGFPFSNYISSERTRKRIDNGNIKEIGKASSLNTEIILDLMPELVVGYSIDTADKSLNTVQNSGLQVIYNSDWLEETPLGRAEWIKFFGILFDKEKEADSIFSAIETNYLKAKNIAKKIRKQQTVISGAIMSKQIWNLPAGESFVAQFLEDANLNYLYKNTKGKGSLSLSLESVFDKGAKADYWIAPGYFSSKAEMVAYNKIYKEFKAFKKNTIYSPSTKKGPTGGVIYYELGPTRPDLVLKDIIKIIDGTLLPNYELTFFEQMK